MVMICGVHFIYLDESGDPGLINSPTKHYILAGLSVSHADWHKVDERLRAFRRWAGDVHGLDPRHEIHAAEFLGAANMHCGLRREQRLLVIRRLMAVLSDSPELRFFGWIADKESPEPLQRAGNRCIMDLKDWLTSGDFSSSNHLFIIHDQMHQTPEAWHGDFHAHIIGRPLSQSSRESRQLQVADLTAYLLKQSLQPNRFLKEQGAHHLIRRLNELTLGWVEV
jgi:hypothetical protein